MILRTLFLKPALGMNFDDFGFYFGVDFGTDFDILGMIFASEFCMQFWEADGTKRCGKLV